MKRGQTATEYIIIVAVVIVITLVVASNLTDFSAIGSGSEKKRTDYSLKIAEVAVDSYAIESNQTRLKIRNNQNVNQEIINITVDGIACDVSFPFNLKVGEVNTVTCSNINSTNVSTSVTPVVNLCWTDKESNAQYCTGENILIPPPTIYFLDTYGPAAGVYSLRKLSSTYSGSCLRIRRSSDDGEQDIGFDSSDWVDESSISTFCGSSSCYVTTWYDQSGDSKDVTQTSYGNQPIIYNGSGFYTSNGKTTIYFNRSANNRLLSQTNPFMQVYPYSVLTVKQWGGVNNVYIWSAENSDLPSQLLQSTRELWRHYTFIIGPIPKTQMQVTLGMTNSGDPCKLRVDSGSTISQVLTPSQVGNNQKFSIGGYGASYFGDYINEIIVWDSDVFANENEIFDNVNTYYSIY